MKLKIYFTAVVFACYADSETLDRIAKLCIATGQSFFFRGPECILFHEDISEFLIRTDSKLDFRIYREQRREGNGKVFGFTLTEPAVKLSDGTFDRDIA